MKNNIKEYQTNGPGYTHHYQIDFRWQATPQHFEIWVPYHPQDPFGNDDNVHHLIATGQLCVRKGREPRDFETAEAVAYYWMERFSRYVVSGKFVDDGAKVEVPD